VKPNWRALRLSACVAAQRNFVQCKNETSWPSTVARRDESTPAIGKELPMELTATMTAIMAIMSFGFVAAVILGMI
jgi:hypothetical protein